MDEASFTAATAPLKVTMLLPDVVLKFNPVIVTIVPALPDDGEKELIDGAGLGSCFFLHPVKNSATKISATDTVFKNENNFNELINGEYFMVKTNIF